MFLSGILTVRKVMFRSVLIHVKKFLSIYFICMQFYVFLYTHSCLNLCIIYQYMHKYIFFLPCTSLGFCMIIHDVDLFLSMPYIKLFSCLKQYIYVHVYWYILYVFANSYIIFFYVCIYVYLNKIYLYMYAFIFTHIYKCMNRWEKRVNFNYYLLLFKKWKYG